jgi:hypothetical protein
MLLRVLVLADLSQSRAAMVADSVNALPRWSRSDVTVVTNGVPQFAPGDLDAFDAVLLHYSIFIDQLSHLSSTARRALRQSRAIKLVWQQDEYRNVSGLAKAMADVDASIVLTCLPRGVAERVFGPYLERQPIFINVLTGYVSDRIVKQDAAGYAARRIDIGYRGRTYPLWHGRLGAERVRAARETKRWATARGLRCDISLREQDRLYGDAWTRFLNDCRASIGTESGANVFDPDNSLPEKVWRFVLRHPFASEAEIARVTYGPLDGIVDYAQVAPRLFEAMAARSLLLLTPGRYSGLITLGRHALMLEPSGLNANEIVDAIRDPNRAANLIDAAYEEVLLRPDVHERAFVAMLDDTLAASVPSGRRLDGTARFPSWSEPRGNAAGRTRRLKRVVTERLVALARVLLDRLPASAARYCRALVHVLRIEIKKRSARGAP